MGPSFLLLLFDLFMDDLLRLVAMKNLFFLCLFVGSLLLAAGCYQAHSDDDLRTVPATNNPHVIMGDRRSVPGANF